MPPEYLPVDLPEIIDTSFTITGCNGQGLNCFRTDRYKNTGITNDLSG